MSKAPSQWSLSSARCKVVVRSIGTLGIADVTMRCSASDEPTTRHTRTTPTKGNPGAGVHDTGPSGRSLQWLEQTPQRSYQPQTSQHAAHVTHGTATSFQASTCTQDFSFAPVVAIIHAVLDSERESSISSISSASLMNQLALELEQSTLEK